MIREIVKDEEVLTQKSERFEIGADDYLIQDMLDTANEHKDMCAGLACIQIGVPKRVILVKMADKFVPIINPTIIKKGKDTFMATERCLSLEGERKVKRYKKIKLAYTTQDGKMHIQDFSGWAAQVIQHECDHLNGILI